MSGAGSANIGTGRKACRKRDAVDMRVITNHEKSWKVLRTRHPKPETHNTKIALRGAKNVAEGSKIEPKWTKMEPLRVPGGGLLDTVGGLGGSLGTLGSSLGALWGPGRFFTPILEHFWLHFGPQNGAKNVPKSV